MTTALIDADIVAFRAAAKSQDDFGDGKVSDARVAIREAEHILEQWVKYVKPNNVLLCFSCPTRKYFRHDIYPEYKAQRVQLEKPPALSQVIEHLKSKHKFMTLPGLEADDVMGIMATGTAVKDGVIVSIDTITPSLTGTAVKDGVIVSIDKDMQTIPAKFINPDKMRRAIRINPGAANLLVFRQAITGDSTDNYRGIPGIGPVKADKILSDANQLNLWSAVEQAFNDNKLTTEYALTMVRLARILRAEDYNFETGEVRLWHPVKPQWMTPSAHNTTNSTASKSTTSSSKSAEISPEMKQSQLPTSSSTSAATEEKTTDTPPLPTSAKAGGISTGSSKRSKQKRGLVNEPS